MRPTAPTGYRLLRPLGRGASAEVWLSEGPHGIAALKLAFEGSSLTREIRALGKFGGAGIAPLLDADPRGAWMAVEYAPNGRVDVWGRGQPLGVLVEFVARLAEALAPLHASGLVHGDIKPSNVLVATDGTPRIVDFGVARPAGGAFSGGTPGFIAPELLRGEPPSAAADLYGVGVLLYLLLTRHPPFRDADPAALACLPLHTLPEPPSSLRPRLPRALDDLVLALLARRTAARPSSAEAVAEGLRASLTSEPRSPVVGMARERELLRRHVVELLEGRPATVVLHGAAGCGRRTLIREAVRAGRREGIRTISGATDRRALLDDLTGEPAILAVDGNVPGVESLLVQVVSQRLPCLALVRADRPLMKLARLDVRHVSPSPFSAEDVGRVLESLQLDRRRGDELHRRSRGSPGALLGLLSAEPATDGLDPTAHLVLSHLLGGPLTVAMLAARVELSEHRLLDLVEPMIDQGLVSASEDGAWISGPARA